MKETTFNKYRIFSVISLFFLGLNFVSIVLALLGFFYSWVIIVYIFFGIAFIFWLLYQNKKIVRFSWDIFLMVIFSLLFISVFAYFSSPSILSGRDQGSFSEAAIRLADNHHLKFSFPASNEFFKIYGPGKALNFPGFNYTEDGNLITQFSIGFVSWLAAFYSVFGLNGFILANAICLLLFLISFFLLIKLFISVSDSFIAFFLTLTVFVFSWFFKFTLSENLALAWVWFGILELVWFWKQKDSFHLFVSVMTFSILAFSRLEAWSFLAMIFILILVKEKSWDNFFKKYFIKKFNWFFVLLLLVYAISLKINSQFFISSAKGFVKSFYPSGQEVADLGLINSFSYVFKVFSIYSLASFIFLSIFGIIYFIKKRKYEILIPLVVTAPTFVYFFHPGISSDHPWMLRRFVFSVIPAMIFISIVFLNKFFTKKLFFYISVTVISLSNLLVTAFFLNYSESRKALKGISQISQNFSGNDLVLVDRLATGDGWQMMTGPMSALFGKQAVYFFNPNDLEKINKNKFKNIYLIIPEGGLDFYKDSKITEEIEFYKNYSIEMQNLSAYENGESRYEFPIKQDSFAYGSIYKFKK